jgi:hypothetical protein
MDDMTIHVHAMYEVIARKQTFVWIFLVHALCKPTPSISDPATVNAQHENKA